MKHGRRIFYCVLLVAWIAALILDISNWLWLGAVFFVPVGILAFTLWTTLQNGYGLAVMFLGALRTMEIRWRGFGLDADNNVVEAVRIPGFKQPKSGLIFVGIWPFHRVHKFKLSWTAVEQDGSVTEHKQEVLDRILLMPKQYYFKVTDAEDKSLMPLTATGSIWMKVVNPEKALFRVDDYVSTVTNEMNGIIRDALTGDEYKQWTKKTADVAKTVMKRVEDTDRRQFIIDNYGVDVFDLIIRSIDPSREEDRKASLAPIQAEFKKTAAVTKAEADAEVALIGARVDSEVDFESRMGALFHLHGAVLGLNREELVEKIKTDEDFRKQIEDLVRDGKRLQEKIEMAKLDARIEWENTGISKNSEANSAGSSGGSPGGGGGLNINGDDLKELLIMGVTLLKKAGLLGGGAQAGGKAASAQVKKSVPVGTDDLTEEDMDELEAEMEAEAGEAAEAESEEV